MTIRISHLAKNQRSSTAVTPASPQHHSLAHTCSAPALSYSPHKAPLLFFAPPVVVTGPVICSCRNSLFSACTSAGWKKCAEKHMSIIESHRQHPYALFSVSGIQFTKRYLCVLAYFMFKIYLIYFFFLRETWGTLVVRWFLLLLPCFLNCMQRTRLLGKLWGPNTLSGVSPVQTPGHATVTFSPQNDSHFTP